MTTANLLETYGVAPELGRGFTAQEVDGAVNVVMVTHAFWQRRLGLDRGALGRSLQLDGRAFQIVGVLPPRFQIFFGLPADVFLPLTFPPRRRADRASHDLLAIGRLKPGVSLEQARDEMGRISAQLSQQYPAT